MGIRDFIFLEKEKVLIIAVSDMNIASRIDAYITNANFPWEKKLDSHITVGAIICYKLKVEGCNYQYDKLWIETFPSQVGVISWDSDSSTLVVGLDDGIIKCFKVPEEMSFLQHEQLCEIHAHSKRVMGAVIDPKIGNVYSCGSDKKFITSEINYQEIVNGIEQTKKRLLDQKDAMG